MFNFYFWRKKRQTPKAISLKDYTEIKHALCLFAVSCSNDKQLDVIITEEDTPGSEKEALDTIELSWKKKYDFVRLYNYRSGQFKMYNKKTGFVITRNLKNTPQKPVDMNAFIKAIQVTATDYPKRVIPPYLFSIIFKILKDGVIGTGYSDLTQVHFRAMMTENGLVTEKKTSFSKYKPDGTYPNWNYARKFKRDSSKKIEEAIAFSKKFICNYNNQISSLDSSLNINTAEETAE